MASYRIEIESAFRDFFTQLVSYQPVDTTCGPVDLKKKRVYFGCYYRV